MLSSETAAMGDSKFKEEDDSRVLQVLEALKQASHDLQAHPAAESGDGTNSSSSAAVKVLLELEPESDSIFSKDPQLSSLSHHLADLKALVDTLRKSRGHSLRSFLARRASTHSISRLAESIGSEIQAWIDREIIEKLIRALKEPIVEEDDLIKLLTQLELRLDQGFDAELQDLVLRSELIRSLDRVLCNSKLSRRTREHAAYAIAALIRFNKDVFVGELMMRATVQIQALISMASPNSLKVLCSLVKSIKSPLVDEIESNGEIPKIISLLSNDDLELQLVAMDCVLEIGYFGRKEAIEAVLNSGLIKRLVELQRSELGGDIIDAAGRVIRERKFWESHPFASCVARFAVQLEVGEGLRRRERRALKQEILKRVKEASVSDAEAATIAAEVLWGSYP